MYTIIDLETTGFSPKRGDKIIEVAAIKINENNEILDQYCTLINPERDISNSDIHGITATDVKKAPIFPEVKDFLKLFLDDSILVAHNAPFDKRFLENEIADEGVEISTLCTIQLSRHIDNSAPSRSLEVLCDYYDIDYPNQHEALSDAIATVRLFKRLRKKFIEVYSDQSFKKAFPIKKTNFANVNANPNRIELKRQEASINSQREKTKIQRFLDRVPIDSISEKKSSRIYLDLLEKILSDRLITNSEVDQLEEVVNDLELAKEEILGLHEYYLSELIDVYLLDDNISDFEQHDLINVSELLGFNKKQLNNLISRGKKRNNINSQNISKENISEKSICFTGKFKAILDGVQVDRSTVQKIAQKFGMIVKKNVTKKLDYLVVADPNTMSSKAKKARKYGIDILAEPEFWRLLNINTE